MWRQFAGRQEWGVKNKCQKYNRNEKKITTKPTATYTTAHFRQHAIAISGGQPNMQVCGRRAHHEGDKRYTIQKKKKQQQQLLYCCKSCVNTSHSLPPALVCVTNVPLELLSSSGVTFTLRRSERFSLSLLLPQSARFNSQMRFSWNFNYWNWLINNTSFAFSTLLLLHAHQFIAICLCGNDAPRRYCYYCCRHAC